MSIHLSSSDASHPLKDPALIDNLRWELGQLNQTTKEFISVAKQENIDVQKQLSKIVTTINSAPQVSEVSQTFAKELLFRQQLTWRGMYCSQIRRKITKHRIKRAAAIAKQIPSLQKKLDIEGTANWLIKQLPSKLNIHYHQADQKCRQLEEKLDEIASKLS